MLEQTRTAVAVRHARLRDVPVLQTLIDQAVRGLMHHDYTPRQVDSAARYLFAVETRLIEDRTYYVAEVNGVLIGAGGWSRRHAFSSYEYGVSKNAEAYLDPRYDAARIRAYFVHPAFARRGIARELLATSEADARSNGFWQTELIASSTGVPLYEKAGYTALGEESVTLTDGVTLTGLRMMKFLN